MKQHVKNFLIGTIFLVELFIVSDILFFYSDLCRHVVQSSYCDFEAYEAPLYKAYHRGVIDIKPGETKRIKLHVRLHGDITPPPSNKIFEFVTFQYYPSIKEENILYISDDGQISISWDGIPFNRDNAYITISASKDAKQSQEYSFYTKSTKSVDKHFYFRNPNDFSRKMLPVFFSVRIQNQE